MAARHLFNAGPASFWLLTFSSSRKDVWELQEHLARIGNELKSGHHTELPPAEFRGWQLVSLSDHETRWVSASHGARVTFDAVGVLTSFAWTRRSRGPSNPEIRAVEYFLRFVLPRKKHNEMIGDLVQEYQEDIVPTYGRWAARCWLARHAISDINAAFHLRWWALLATVLDLLRRHVG